MNLVEAIKPSLVQFDFDVKSKEDTIKKVIDLMKESDLLSDADRYLKDVYKRESESTTGIGMGIAIPHAKSEGVKETCFSLIKLKDPIEWESLDEKPVNYVIMLAVPSGANDEYLRILSTLATNLMDDDFRESLITSETIEDVYETFKNTEVV